MTHRRRWWPLVLVVLFVLLPMIEIYIIVKVGEAIGGWQTLLLLIVWSLIGVWIVRREWSSTFGALTEALRTGRMPTRELTDAALALVGGVLLLVPGFLTDVIGLILILPFTRPITRPLLQALVARRVLATTGPGVVRSTSYQTEGYAGDSSGGTAAQDEIIEGEIVDED